jgi:hypothetical protein
MTQVQEELKALFLQWSVMDVRFSSGDLVIVLGGGHEVKVKAESDVFDKDFLRITTYKTERTKLGEIQL